MRKITRKEKKEKFKAIVLWLRAKEEKKRKEEALRLDKEFKKERCREI